MIVADVYFFNPKKLHPQRHVGGKRHAAADALGVTVLCDLARLRVSLPEQNGFLHHVTCLSRPHTTFVLNNTVSYTL